MRILPTYDGRGSVCADAADLSGPGQSVSDRTEGDVEAAGVEASELIERTESDFGTCREDFSEVGKMSMPGFPSRESMRPFLPSGRWNPVRIARELRL